MGAGRTDATLDCIATGGNLRSSCSSYIPGIPSPFAGSRIKSSKPTRFVVQLPSNLHISSKKKDNGRDVVDPKKLEQTAL